MLETESMKPAIHLFILIMSLASTKADIERFSLVQTDSLIIKSEDGSASLRVEIERFDRDQLKTTEAGGDFTVWHGKRQLPFDVLLIPTMIKSLELTIDGKRVRVPKNFWNDIGGFQLKKLVIDPKRPLKTPEDDFALEGFMEENSRSFPTLSRTPEGSTILITWARSEE